MDFRVMTVIGLPTAAICLAVTTAPSGRLAGPHVLSKQEISKALLEGDLSVLPPSAVNEPCPAVVAKLETTASPTVATFENVSPFDWQRTHDAWNTVCRTLQERGVAIQQSIKLLTIQRADAPPAIDIDRAYLLDLSSDIHQTFSDLWGGSFFANLRARCTAWSEQGEAREFVHPTSEHLFVYTSASGPASIPVAAGNLFAMHETMAFVDHPEK